MKPEKFLSKVDGQLKAMKKMKKKHVAVGILASEATSRIYDSGANVLDVAVSNEFGTRTTPERSFLRMPQEVKDKEIRAFINKKTIEVLEGAPVDKGLGLIGTYVVNVTQKAFASNGFGKWAPLDPKTIKKKGSSATLIDKGTLKNSVTYEVRK